jgi:prepilin-type N-terminal cleavage/methylation domain-containing protein
MKTGMMQRRLSRAGFTLVELLCAAAIFLIGLGAAFVTYLEVQHSLFTSLYQISAQDDQSRVFGYLRRDLRGASGVQISAGGTQLNLTVPTQPATTFNLNLGLSLLSLLGPTQTPNATETIQWYRQGTSVIREVNGVSTVLSSSATQFQCTLSGTEVQITAGFQPRYTFFNQNTVSPATSVTACVHLLNTTAPVTAP